MKKIIMNNKKLENIYIDRGVYIQYDLRTMIIGHIDYEGTGLIDQRTFKAIKEGEIGKYIINQEGDDFPTPPALEKVADVDVDWKDLHLLYDKHRDRFPFTITKQEGDWHLVVSNALFLYKQKVKVSFFGDTKPIEFKFSVDFVKLLNKIKGDKAVYIGEAINTGKMYIVAMSPDVCIYHELEDRPFPRYTGVITNIKGDLNFEFTKTDLKLDEFVKERVEFRYLFKKFKEPLILNAYISWKKPLNYYYSIEKDNWLMIGILREELKKYLIKM